MISEDNMAALRYAAVFVLGLMTTPLIEEIP